MGNAVLLLTAAVVVWLIFGPSVWRWLDGYQACEFVHGPPNRRARFARWLIVHVSVQGRRNSRLRSSHNAALDGPNDA